MKSTACPGCNGIVEEPANGETPALITAYFDASNEEQSALGIGLHDFEIERGRLLVTEVAGHAQTLEHATRERARTDRARRTVVLVVTVTRTLAVEVVTLHTTGESLTAADGGDVELINITEDGIVEVKLQGACGSCPMATLTLKAGIERVLKEHIKEVKEVRQV